MFSWYQEKRRLGITSKTALFCCGSERTLYGETAAEEIGVRPIPVWVYATKKIPTENENSWFRIKPFLYLHSNIQGIV